MDREASWVLNKSSTLTIAVVPNGSGSYNGVHIPLWLHDTLLVNQAKVIGLHIPKRLAERIDPEVIWLDRISHLQSNQHIGRPDQLGLNLQ
jgi:hypothetical protein